VEELTTGDLLLRHDSKSSLAVAAPLANDINLDFIFSIQLSLK